MTAPTLQLENNTKKLLKTASEQFGTPTYVYFWEDMQNQLKLIDSVFGGRFKVSYAVKANPNHALLKALDSHVATLDVSSAGELLHAISCGYDPQRLSFSGPGKSETELITALDNHCGKLIAESVDELEDLNRLAHERDIVCSVVLRIGPSKTPKGFGVNMAGRPSQFGIDEEVLDSALERLADLQNLRFAGFHIYAGAQCLDADAIVENYSNYIKIFTEFSERHQLYPEQLIFGGGIGIPYHAGDTPIDLQTLATAVNPLLDNLLTNPHFQKTHCVLEIGRLIVGEAGYFLTKVTRTKQSRGKELRICDGGLNNHLAACGHFGSIIHRNYRMTNLDLSDQEITNAKEETSFDVFGPLCTTIDQLARDIKLTKLECGDVLVIGSSGAYGFSASPMYFISHPPAKEIMIFGKGEEAELKDVSTHLPV